MEEAKLDMEEQAGKLQMRKLFVDRRMASTGRHCRQTQG
jgi:hypothetical protein